MAVVIFMLNASTAFKCVKPREAFFHGQTEHGQNYYTYTGRKVSSVNGYRESSVSPNRFSLSLDLQDGQATRIANFPVVPEGPQPKA